MTHVAHVAAHLRARVEAARPGLIPAHAPVRLTRGQFNDVLIVEDAFVFRFPRSAGAASTLRIEIDLLRALQGRLPLPIPTPEFVQIDPGAPEGGFAGYRMLPGEPLSQETVSRSTPAEVTRIAAQIAGFLRDLHAIPAEIMPALPTADTPSDWAKLLAAFEAELFPSMRPDARTDVSRSFAKFLDAAGELYFTPALRHGDLGGDNIRYDPATTRVTGVIDFASAAMGDPAVDLAGLSWYGEAFVAALSEGYPTLADHALRSRARFYRSTFALQQALWAIRAGDAAEFEDGIAGYR
jgi:aminoglycoside 2''-phosphotransferase